MSEETSDKNSFFLDYAKMINEHVRESQDNMYTKIKDLNTIIIAVLPILFAVVAFCFENTYFNSLLLPIGLIITFLGGAAIQGFWILLHNESNFLDPYLLIQTYYEQDLDFIKLKTANTLAILTMKNHETANLRALQYRNMLVLVGIGLVILIGAFWISIGTYTQYIANNGTGT